MKRVFSMLAVSAMLTVGLAQAQSRTSLSADVPFAFRAGKAVMPAGHYEVVEGSAPGVVSLRCTTAYATAAVITMPRQSLKTPEQGSLIFNKYGEKYFLSKIWKPGEATGRELSRTESEREMAKAAKNSELASVRIALR